MVLKAESDCKPAMVTDRDKTSLGKNNENSKEESVDAKKNLVRPQQANFKIIGCKPIRRILITPFSPLNFLLTIY